jgi:hypothetical protein
MEPPRRDREEGRDEVKAVHGTRTAHSAARRREASVFSARGHDHAYSFS